MKTVFTLIICILFSVLNSCASSIPAATDPSKGVVVVIIDHYNPHHIHSGVDICYEMRIPNNPDVMYLKPDKSYEISKLITAGSFDHILMKQKVEYNQGGGWASGAQDNQIFKFDINYTVQSGYINFFPVKLVYSTKKGANGVYRSMNFIPITESDRQRVLADLRKNRNFSGWKIN